MNPYRFVNLSNESFEFMHESFENHESYEIFEIHESLQPRFRFIKSFQRFIQIRIAQHKQQWSVLTNRETTKKPCSNPYISTRSF